MFIDRYEVIRDLKQGGMAKTMLARSQTGRLVVLKTPLTSDPDLCARMRDEARVGSRLLHPGLVETLDLCEHEGRPVLVVDYIEGASVEQLRRRAPLTAAAVASLGTQLGRALHALHTAEDETHQPLEILHRDVTGSNVLVDREGRARLIDLGIARWSEERSAITEPGSVVGTVRYLAPELIRGTPHSPDSDAWALGCVLFEAAAGRPCYPGAPAEALAAMTTGSPVEVSGAASELDPMMLAVFSDIFARSPDDRPSCAEIALRCSEIEGRLTEADGGTKELARRVDDLLVNPEPQTPRGEKGTKIERPPKPLQPVPEFNLPPRPREVTVVTPVPRAERRRTTTLAIAAGATLALVALAALVLPPMCGDRDGDGDGAVPALPPPRDPRDPRDARDAGVLGSNEGRAADAGVVGGGTSRDAGPWQPFAGGLRDAGPSARAVPPREPEPWRPACWTGSGAIIYVDARGTPTIVSDPAKVPTSARATARCSW